MSRIISILWITNPWDTLDHKNDTTLRLIQESIHHKGFKSYWCNYQTIRFEEGEILLDAKLLLKVNATRKHADFTFSKAAPYNPDFFDFVHYRVDPPVNNAYRYPLQLLILNKELKSSNAKSKILNPPEEILLTSEKFGQASISGLFPKGIITSDWAAFLKFGNIAKKSVLKPLNNAQSIGVKLLKWNTPEDEYLNKKILERATENFTTPVLLQTYLAGIEKEEIRMWFLNGRLLSCVKKIPTRNDFILNIDKGDAVEYTELNEQQLETAHQIGNHLKKKNLFLAAIDTIDNLITDYNITSPGLLVQMEIATRKNLAAEILEAHNQLS